MEEDNKDQVKEHVMGEWSDALSRREQTAQIVTDLSITLVANIAISWGLVASAIALTPTFNPLSWGLLVAGLNGLGSLPLLTRESGMRYAVAMAGGRLAIAGVVNGGLLAQLAGQAKSDSEAISYLTESAANYQAGFPVPPPPPKFAANSIIAAGTLAVLVIILKVAR